MRASPATRVILALSLALALHAPLSSAESDAPERFIAAVFTGDGLDKVTSLAPDVVLFARVDTGLIGAPRDTGHARVADGASVTVSLVDAASRAVVIDAHDAAVVRFTLPDAASTRGAGAGLRVTYGDHPLEGRFITSGGASLTIDAREVRVDLSRGARVVAMTEPVGAFRESFNTSTFAADVRVEISHDTLVPGSVRAWVRDAVRPGDSIAWNVAVAGNGSQSLRVTVPGAYFSAVARAAQILPEVNRVIPGEVAMDAFARARGNTSVFNHTVTADGTHVFLLKVPAAPAESDGTRRFETRLVRDVIPPRIEAFRPGLPSPTGFILEVVTDEDATATLAITRVGTDASTRVLNGSGFAPHHTFLVKELTPGTNYSYAVTLVDHAGNVRSTSTYTLTTPTVRTKLRAELVEIHPGDGAALENEPEVRAVWRLPEGASLAPSRPVRLFFDGEPVPERAFTATNTSITFQPRNLAAGPHTIRLEVHVADGETSTATWTFSMIETSWFPIPGLASAASVAAAAILARAARSPPRREGRG